MNQKKSYKQFKDLSKKDLNDAFKSACLNGEFDKVIYLLTSPELNEHANIHYGDDDGIRWACAGNHVEIVKFLLTSPELKEHASMEEAYTEGFHNACENDSIEVVKYLLTTPELKEYASTYSYARSYGFQLAYERNNLDLIKCLILDCNLEKDEYIKELLIRSPNEEIENWFKIRNLNNQLEKDLHAGKSEQKKPKL